MFSPPSFFPWQREGIYSTWQRERFISPTNSTIYGNNYVHFRGSLISNKFTNLVKFSRSISEFENIIMKIGNIDCGCMISGRKHILTQFHARLVLLSFLLDHVDTIHLALYVENLRYWPTVCHFLFHFVCRFLSDIIWVFCNLH